jgi:hypothetical protein
MKNLIATILLIAVLAFTDKPSNQEPVYKFEFSGPELAALINGLKGSNAPYAEINFILSSIDKQLVPQLKADTTKKKK